MKVIIIDDEPDYGNSLKESCELHFGDTLDFEYHQTLVAGMVAIKAEPENILMAIVDAKGQIDEGGSGSDEMHLVMAMKELGALRENGIVVNYVIHSAFSDIMSKYGFLRTEFGVEVSKEQGPNGVIDHIEIFQETHSSIHLQRKFPSAYKAFTNNVIDSALRTKLDAILQHLVDGKLTNETDDQIGSMRKIIEVVCFNAINLLPAANGTPTLKQFTDNASALDNAVKYITGNSNNITLGAMSYSCPKLVPGHVSDALWFVKNCTNKIGAHKSKDISFSFNIFSSLCFALIEVLDWYSDYMISK